MTLTELIDLLTDVRDLHGDLEVKVCVGVLSREGFDTFDFETPSLRVLEGRPGLTGKTLVIDL